MKLFKRKPDLVIGPDYMHRWYVIPRNRWFNIYLHKIMHDDDDRALHDHPWFSVSFLLKGRLREIYRSQHPYLDIVQNLVRYPRRFVPVFRPARFAHRLEVVEPAWTLFITGPKIRTWGFWCPERWVPWRDFVNPVDTGKVGRGCGED